VQLKGLTDLIKATLLIST